MTPFGVAIIAVAIILVFTQMGMRAGAFAALCGMLSTVLGLLAALRYWFLLSRVASQNESPPVPFHALIIFWGIFMGVVFIAIRFRQNYTEEFESAAPPAMERVIGAAFGLVNGLVIMSAVTMSITVAAPEFWPAYRSDNLPMNLDRWPLQAYRFVETSFAGISPTETGHTPLPSLKDKAAETPADFWQ